MAVLSCVIIDDEPLPKALLQDYILQTPFLQLTGVFSNPLEALAALQQQPADLVFLDIQMPELNGLQLKQLLGNHCKVIFTTAYPQYALEGYELDVVDYLLKPISLERFLKAVAKARERIAPVPEKTAPFLLVKTDGWTQKVNLHDLLFAESLKEYVALHTVRGKIMTLQSIRRLEEVLPAEQFVRVHKSFIIALSGMEGIERNRIRIGSHYIPIGEHYKAAFMDLIARKNLL
ncbi:LytR/AlgR family response regulator transcription factor [Chitinophaga qingshengii]|uniref:Response regulator transcription factor n=1 Tax=Chitinophaga qingshengii TaxID=1569794 RepID=A0ABR7TJ32_9BACT|nr:LytTR family DNA-binding domain-containing protein [Chitinophaga qingshengii]MBC9929049.1 response regulator transcription factor [Chitinophaga qingshengii]